MSSTSLHGDAAGGMPADTELIVQSVEACLRDFVTQRGLPAALEDAVLYAGLGPGKRVRPTLAVRACEAVGGGLETPGLLSAATAVEMVHAFSLVHDDLPAMDDDDLRRGRPTLHKHTNEAMAILAGDGLMSMAFEVLVTGGSDVALMPRLTRELSVATTDMIAGQVHDMMPDFEEHIPEIDRLVTTHRLKTGALLRASARMGAWCGGADAEQLEALTHYADAVGLMFQVVDDVLDATANSEQLGKTAGKDAATGKRTYPSLMGLDGARAQVVRLRDEAVEALSLFDGKAEPLRKLARTLAERER